MTVVRMKNRPNGKKGRMYKNWQENRELSRRHNYFAVDAPYAEEDYRILHLRGGHIVDVTPAGITYKSHEQAARALFHMACSIADEPYNLSHDICSYMVNSRSQLEKIRRIFS